MYELGQKEERAPYGRVEESLGAILIHYPKASAHFPHRRSRSSSRNKLLQCLWQTDLRIADMSLRWIKQHHRPVLCMA